MPQKTPILFTEESWQNSFLSVARITGSIRVYQREYIIVNKDGEDVWLLSKRAKGVFAIPPGEPADLIDRTFQPVYQKLGRELFMECAKSNMSLDDMRKLSLSLKKDDNPQPQPHPQQ